MIETVENVCIPEGDHLRVLILPVFGLSLVIKDLLFFSRYMIFVLLFLFSLAHSELSSVFYDKVLLLAIG